MNIVAKAGIWMVAVTMIDKGISVLTQPFINRILSIDELGVYSVYSSWFSIVSILATLNLFCGVLETYITKDKEHSSSVVASLMTLSVSISGLFFLLVFIFIKPISGFFSLKPVYVVIMAAETISNALIQFWAVEKRFRYSYVPYAHLIVGLFFVKSVLSILLAYWMDQDRVLGRLLGLAIPNLLVALTLGILLLRKAKGCRITAYWKKGLAFNIPLIPHYLASILLASSDRIMIEKLSGISDAGLYNGAYQYASLALIAFSALNTAVNPYFMSSIKDKDYDGLSKTTRMLLFLSMLFALVLALLAPEGLFLFGAEKYLPAVKIVPVLVLGIFFSSFYFIFSNVEFIYEKTKAVFLITLVGAGLNIGLNYLLIPYLGYEAAAYTTLLGYLVIAVAHFVVSLLIVK